MATFLEQTQQFLNADVEQRDMYLQGILETINDLMLDWKRAIVNGSKKEQHEVIEKINEARGVLKDYFEKAKEELNLNSQEMEQIAQHAMDKSPSRERIVDFRKEFENHSEEIVNLVGKKKKDIKKRTIRAGWIQS